jgi:hypothetical protein
VGWASGRLGSANIISSSPIWYAAPSTTADCPDEGKVQDPAEDFPITGGYWNRATRLLVPWEAISRTASATSSRAKSMSAKLKIVCPPYWHAEIGHELISHSGTARASPGFLHRPSVRRARGDLVGKWPHAGAAPHVFGDVAISQSPGPNGIALGNLPRVERVELDSPHDVGDAGLAGLAGREVSGLLGFPGAGPAGAAADEESGHEDLEQERGERVIQLVRGEKPRRCASRRPGRAGS